MPKYKLLKKCDQIMVPRTIIKFTPKIFGTKDSINDPECQIKIKVCLWITDHLPKNIHSFNKVATKLVYAEVDFEKRVLLKNNEPIDAANTTDVINLLEDIKNYSK